MIKLTFLLFSFFNLIQVDFFPLESQDQCIIEINRPAYACEGEEVTLTASPGFENYYWSNGDTGQVITLISPVSDIRVIGITEEGCVATIKTSIHQPNPSYIGGAILGGYRTTETHWRDIYFHFDNDRPSFEYIWTLNGDTIGFENALQIDSLAAPATYDSLGLEVTSGCGASKNTWLILYPIEEEEIDTFTLCDPYSNFSFNHIQIAAEGEYVIYTFNIWGPSYS